LGAFCIFISSIFCLELSGQEELAKHYSDEITIRIDGNFKNNPKNIWYEGDK
jgi:hypothetical protein